MTTSRHTLTADVAGVALSVIDAEVTLDEGWSPYAQARLTCWTPAVEALEAIDPRLNLRAHLRLQQSFGGSEPLSVWSADWTGDTLADATLALAGTYLAGLSATYGRPYNATGMRASTRRTLTMSLRAREVDHATGTMRVVLASDESLLQDFALVDTAVQTPGSTDLRTIATWVLGNIGAVLQTGTATGTVAADSTDWKPGVSAWDYIAPLVNSVGLRLWCDEERNWWLTQPLDGTAGALTLAATNTITQAEDLIDRDEDWYDAVVVTYRWTDVSNVEHETYDIAQVDGFSKVYAVTYERVYPGTGAAAALLARAVGRGRQISAEAISDYTATPGQAATITVADTPPQTGIASAVSWRFPDDEMAVKTRGLIDTPLTSWLFTTTGYGWDDVAAGIDWTEYTAPEGI